MMSDERLARSLGEDAAEDEGPQPKLWLITLTDLLSLLLTFFVLLFAMSEVQTGAWTTMVQTLSHSLNPSAVPAIVPVKPAPPPKPPARAVPIPKDGASLAYLDAILKEKFSQDPALAQARLHVDNGRLTISLPTDLLFAPSSAELTPAARRVLFDLGGVLSNLPNGIAVAGHTDPTQPGPKTGFESNWELSLARAAAVADALNAAGYGPPIIAFGHGQSRFGDLDSALPEAARYRLARRVDVVVLPSAPEH